MARKVTPVEGHFYEIRGENSTIGVVRILKQTQQALNSAYCSVWATRTIPEEIHQLERNRYLGEFFLTLDLIANGVWTNISIDSEDVTVPAELRDYERVGFVGCKIIGSGIIIKLLQAYFGEFPWNGMADEKYFDKIVRKEFVPPLSIVRISK